MIWLVLSALASVPWLGLRISSLAFGANVLNPHQQPALVAILTGLAIVGAAYLLSVGAEIAQLDISRSLALAFLALIAILPEYAVDMVFAWKGGKDVSQIHFATANMTGANRLLIGLFWPVVVFLFARKYKRKGIRLDSPFRLEVFFLLLATAYSFTIPFRKQIHLVDFVLLASIFFWYAFRASKAHQGEQPHLEGMARRIGDLGRRRRRQIVLLMFFWAALGILAAAEPFAESLVSTGSQLLGGVLGEAKAQFLVVQWVAPLASEFPELIVAGLFALKGMPESALGTLISSKVNQWTLLIGALPVVFVISHVWHGNGFVWSLPLDSFQAEEIFLTSAQSLFAAILLVNLELNVREAQALLILFLGQFLIPIPAVRIGFAIVYLGLSVVILLADRGKRRALTNIVGTRGAVVPADPIG